MSSCPSGVGWCAGVGGSVAANTFAAALQFLVHSQCLISELWPQQATLQNGSSVDVIIVGAGTAGSALAARLAETNLTVLLLEAGGDPPMESIVPGFHTSLLHGEHCWNFTTRNDRMSSQELENHRQRLTAGRLLGGTGSINYMIHSRSFPADYNEIADILGDDSWNWDNVLPYFKKTERMVAEPIVSSPSAKYHGLNGDIQVSGANPNLGTVTLLDAFAELGFKVVDDRNNPEYTNNKAYLQTYTVKDGKRQSSLTAMLNKMATKENLYVMKNALVSKILIKNETAYGVKVLIGDDEWEFYANKEVIVSAGVYNTPKLLMLSGIASYPHILHSYDIADIKKLPVGENLQDHVHTFTFLAAESDLCNSNDTFEAIQYLYNRTGLLSIPSQMGVDYSLKSSANPDVPDFGIFPYCVPKGSNYTQECVQLLDFTNETCSFLHSLNKEHELFPIEVLLRKPKSRGLVTLTSSDPLENPAIYAGAFIKEEDLDGFPEVIEVARSLVNTTYFKSKNAFVVDLQLKSCEGLEWPENIKCTVKSMAKFEGHAVGTAAMGNVLDSRMRVLGINKLRVVDASAIPITLRSGTNAAVVMLAEKAADFIKEDHEIIHQLHYHGQHDHNEQDNHNEEHDHHRQHDDDGRHEIDEQHGQNDHNAPGDHHGKHDHHKQHDDDGRHEIDEQHGQNDHFNPGDHHEKHDHQKQHDDDGHHEIDEQHGQNDHFSPGDYHEKHDHHKQHDDDGRHEINEQHGQNDHYGPDDHHEKHDNHEHHGQHDHYEQHDHHDNQDFIVPKKDDLFYGK